MSINFLGKAAPLTQGGFDDALSQLAVDQASLWALVTVETRGFGFLPDRRPKILFERHIFHQRTTGRFDAAAPDLSADTAGGYIGGAAEYSRLGRAMQLDQRNALESVSWGLGQIMGFNASALGYVGVEGMIASFLDGEDAQLEGVRRFILRNAALSRAFRTQDWKSVAFFYNGKNFAKNAYDTKLDRFHGLYVLPGKSPSIALRSQQARLTYLGFDTRGVDGVVGDGTRAAIVAFQKAKGLSPSAELDGATSAALLQAAGV